MHGACTGPRADAESNFCVMPKKARYGKLGNAEHPPVGIDVLDNVDDIAIAMTSRDDWSANKSMSSEPRAARSARVACGAMLKLTGIMAVVIAVTVFPL